MGDFLLRLWSYRILRYGTWVIVATVTLYVLLCAYVNWSGARHWAQVKARIESEGETFDFKKLLPPAVDKATNFCAIDALDGIALEGDEQSPQGKKRKVLESLGWKSFSALAPRLPDGRATGSKADLGEWIKFAHDTAFVQMPVPSGNVARDLLQAIDQSQPLVKVLADTATTRPNTVFTPSIRDRPQASLLIGLRAVPHYSAAHNACRVLGLRALAASEAADSAAATASVQAMLRLTDAFAQEPFLLGLLEALAVHSRSEEAVWSLLERRIATESELHAVQASLDHWQFDRAALHALRGECAVAVETYTSIQEHPDEFFDLFRSSLGGTDPPFMDGVIASSKYLGMICKMVPAGIFDENKAVFAGLEFDHLIKPLEVGGYSNLCSQEKALESELRARRDGFHPGHFAADAALAGMLRVMDMALSSEAIRRQAVVACALERYFLQHKAYPAALAELVPAFIAAIPNDPMDDKPMRYRQASDGRYMLWSVGFDQKDDNGKVTIDPENVESSRHKLFHREYRGDWTWQYQPIK